MKKKTASRIWCSFALFFAFLAFFLAFTGGADTLLLFPKAQPEGAADAFFAALENGDYVAASELCSPSLPAESYPDDADAARVYDALCASRHWQREGGAVISGIHATVTGKLTVLNPSSLCEGLNEDVNAVLAQLVAEARLGSDIFNEDGSYKDEVVFRAWNSALDARLENSENYTITCSLTIPLIYKEDRWLVQADEELMKALSGGEA